MSHGYLIVCKGTRPSTVRMAEGSVLRLAKSLIDYMRKVRA